MARGDWSTYRRLLGYVGPYWLLLAISLVGFLLAAGAEGYFAALFGKVIDQWDPDNVHEGAEIWMIVGLSIPAMMILAALARAVGTILGEMLISRASFHVVYDLRQALFGQLLKLPSSYYDASTQGHLVSRITFTVTQLREAGTDALKIVVQDSLKVIVYLGWMLWLNWQMTLVFIATAPLLALVVVFASSRFRRISRRIQNSMGDVTHVVSETVNGYRVVRTFGGEEYERQRFERFSRINRQQNMKMVITKVSSAQLNETIVATALCGLIFLLSDTASQMTPGDMVTFLGLAGMLARPIRKLSEVNAKLQRGLAAAEDVFGQLDQAAEPDAGQQEVQRVTGSIRFERVNFQYDENEAVLKDINLTIDAGQTVALVGKSGSGKTTLASLLPRFYEVNSGSISIDGMDIQHMKLESLRQQIALVSQHVTLFNDTLRSNIAYGSLADVSEADLQQAIQRAHASEFVSSLKDGMETVLGDDGVLLSGGQRQRVAIARALLKDAPVLILDEATSALDNESERHIQAALDAVMEGRTTIVIAHRLSTIENADLIVVLDKGQIVERGTHVDLLAAGGLYSELHSGEFADSSEATEKRAKQRRNRTGVGLPQVIKRSEPYEKSALGLSKAWYHGAWWLQFLRPFSWLYNFERKRRQRKYTLVETPGRTRLPVIVVGNITVGGTGKTPVVCWLVERLRELGFRPGIVLRGYGGGLSPEGTLIPTAADPERYSDEGVQLRDRLNCPIAMCADRVKGLRILETQDCDIAISDDGLQHYRMARDIEICVIDGARGVGNGWLLPAGPLREPVSRLENVDWVISNGQLSNLTENESVMQMQADGFMNVTTGDWVEVDDFLAQHTEVHAVCGIGNPNRFLRTLSHLGLVAELHVYKDHYDFAGDEVCFDDTRAVVCTEKDAAKLKNIERDFSHVWYLRVSVQLPGDDAKRLEQLLAERAIAPQRENDDSVGDLLG
ncbi:MAG: lipid A export permease/ATP-binding protein MsbA [Pseudomonadota bacterium]